jgi:hypothetical protein
MKILKNRHRNRRRYENEPQKEQKNTKAFAPLFADRQDCEKKNHTTLCDSVPIEIMNHNLSRIGKRYKRKQKPSLYSFHEHVY